MIRADLPIYTAAWLRQALAAAVAADDADLVAELTAALRKRAS